MIQRDQPFVVFVPILPDDVVDLLAYTATKQTTGAVYVGGAGDVVAVSGSGIATTFSSVPAGTTLPISVRRINVTNTSATNLVACYTA